MSEQITVTPKDWNKQIHVTVHLECGLLVLFYGKHVELIDDNLHYHLSLDQFRDVLKQESRRRKQIQIDTSKDKPCNQA